MNKHVGWVRVVSRKDASSVDTQSKRRVQFVVYKVDKVGTDSTTDVVEYPEVTDNVSLGFDLNFGLVQVRLDLSWRRR